MAKTKAKPVKAKKAPAPTKEAKGKTKVKSKSSKPSKSKKSKKSKKPAVTFEVNDTVKFVGYKDQPKEPLFEAGQLLRVVEIEESKEHGTILSCIDAGDYDDYQDDPDAVEGEQLSTKEVKKVKAKLPAKVIEPIEVRDVGEMKKLMKKGDLVSTAQSLLEEAAKNFFYLGGVLAHLFHENIFRQDDDYKEGTATEAWNKFCMDKFGWKGRKGSYLIDTYLTFSSLPDFDIKQLPKLGWSKAAEIARYATADNVDELVSKGEEMSITDLKAHMKEEYTTEGGLTSGGREGARGTTKIKKVTFAFKLFEDHASGVQMVFDKAKKELGLSDDDQAFEHIIMAWAGDHLGEKDAKRVSSTIKKKRKELKKQGVDTATSEETDKVLAAA